MSEAFKALAERQIIKATAEGQFEGLAGEGKPLPRRTDAPGDDIAVEVGQRVMSEAGILPREVQLKQRLDAARAALGAAEGETAQKAAMAELAKAELDWNLALEARKRGR